MITSLFYFDGQGKVGAHLSFLVFACPTAFVVEATLYLSPARPEVERRGARWRPINYLLLSLEIGIKNNFCKVCQALFWQTTFAMIIHKRLAQNVCVREREGRLAVRGNTKESPRCAPSPRGCCSYKYLGCFPSRGEPPFLPLFFFFFAILWKNQNERSRFFRLYAFAGGNRDETHPPSWARSAPSSARAWRGWRSTRRTSRTATRSPAFPVRDESVFTRLFFRCCFLRMCVVSRQFTS
jgi:hypothetical protein